MNTITELQLSDLIKRIYDTMISDPEYGMGDAAQIHDAASSIVYEWMKANDIRTEL